MLLLATELRTSTAPRRASKNRSWGRGFASDRFLTPPPCSSLLLGTRSGLVRMQGSGGVSPRWTQHRARRIYVMGRQHIQCQNEKTLQFQLHTCKPWIRIDPARCFPIIIHFLLLTSLNKYNSPNQILTISPVLNLMNFLSFMPFSQYAT